jgi:hypothetical protein
VRVKNWESINDKDYALALALVNTEAISSALASPLPFREEALLAGLRVLEAVPVLGEDRLRKGVPVLVSVLGKPACYAPTLGGLVKEAPVWAFRHPEAEIVLRWSPRNFEVLMPKHLSRVAFLAVLRDLAELLKTVTQQEQEQEQAPPELPPAEAPMPPAHVLDGLEIES